MNDSPLHSLAQSLSRLKKAKQVAEFLQEILTPSECSAVILRWRICQLLLKGETQRDISRQLGVSLCKITRGARELKKPGSLLRKLLAESGSLSKSIYPKKDKKS